VYLSDCLEKSVEARALLDPRLVLPRDIYSEVGCGYRLLAAKRKGKLGGCGGHLGCIAKMMAE
jgi:hypothetical protein